MAQLRPKRFLRRLSTRSLLMTSASSALTTFSSCCQSKHMVRISLTYRTKWWLSFVKWPRDTTCTSSWSFIHAKSKMTPIWTRHRFMERQRSPKKPTMCSSFRKLRKTRNRFPTTVNLSLSRIDSTASLVWCNWLSSLRHDDTLNFSTKRLSHSSIT